MGHIGPHHLESYLLLPHDLKPVHQKQSVSLVYKTTHTHRNKQISLVFILVSEGFVNTFGDWLAVEDEAFCDRRLQIRKTENQPNNSTLNKYYPVKPAVHLTMLGS